MRRFLFRVWQWLRAEIVFGFLIATVFWATVLGWQAAYAPTDAEKQKCYDAAEHTGHKTDECKSLWERTTSDPVAFFTFWLVIFTGGLTVSTILLWRAGERQFGHAQSEAEVADFHRTAQFHQITEQIEALKQSAKAAEDNARETRSLVWTSERTAMRQLRAYLGLVRFDIHWERREFIIVIRNDGQTPAREVTPFFNMQWYELGGDMPADFAFDDYLPSQIGSGPIFITPGQEHPWSFQLDWEKFTLFNQGRLAQFYVYGRFEYFDVFDQKRISEFCYQAVRFASGGGAFRVARRHNDAT